MRKTLIAVLSLVFVIAVGTGGYAWYQAQNDESASDIAANDLSNGTPPAAGEPTLVEGPQSTPATGAQGIELNKAVAEQEASSIKPEDVHVTVNGGDPKSPRSIGKVDAPVTMIEYSSLTCPHCAHAHQTILPQLIKDYVETGKLRIVFSDFPLNQQALDASKVSRCVADNQYFGFLTLLFSSIDKWAYASNHPNALLQNAALAGLPAEKARACLNDTALESALVKGVQDAVGKYSIDSTPTFVLNDGKARISGARPYADFKKEIDALIPAGK